MSSAIAKKIRGLLLKSRSTLIGTRAGFFRTNRAGSGYDFDQLVEYREGADVRRIDWKSSARSNTLLLREYKDEQQRVMHIIADTSASLDYGSQKLLLSHVCTELVTAFECIASQSSDAVIKHEWNGQRTDFASQIKTIAHRFNRRSLIVIISDFIHKEYHKAISLLSQQHEVILVRLRDVREAELMHAYAYVSCQDREHEGLWLSLNTQQNIDACAWRARQERDFKKLPLAWLDCFNDGKHLERLVSFVNRY